MNVTDEHVWWSIDEAATHVGFTRSTVERYIREGLTVIFRQHGGFVNRDQFLAMYREKQLRQHKTWKGSKL